ncbi:class I SAM-dependent methyltransferase [Mycobacterium persicum]|uniref:class I SAM-dependent methyltransferase n=1 Tax=Mycobacterium persicum TaxID=1487726 RepID=UPI0009F4F048|nr:class I SAM-dependent methyltransferase [Mycobacterium persicum]ORB45352.1 SAM-dependent methyltransferase [Mycobacterium persicum]
MLSSATIPGVSVVTQDGSAVEIYRRMPSLGEIERIRSLLAPSSSVLELGAGTGRIADALAALGHRVTAVDDSPEMLAHIRRARVIQARIEDVRLAEKFDAVLLVSNLINYPDAQLRRSMLATVAHHLAPTGQAIIEWVPPSMLASRQQGWTKTLAFDGAEATLTIHSNAGGIVTGEFTLTADGQRWHQSLVLQRVSPATVRDELTAAGLTLMTAAPNSTRWLLAKRR